MAEPEIIRRRERDLAVRAKRDREALERRRAEGRKRSPTGQILETYRGPDTLGGALYDLVGRGVGGVRRLFGATPDEAQRSRFSAERKAREIGEFIVGPEEVERSARKIARGEGGGMDYAILGLTVAPMPGPLKKGLKSLAVGAKRAGTKAAKTRVGRALTKVEPLAESFAARPRVSRGIPRERVFTVTAEDTPGALSQHRADILKGDFAARQKYGKQAPWTRMTPEGDAYDVMYAAQDIPQRPVEEAVGAYLNSRGELENSPVYLTQLDVGGEPSAEMLARIRATENLRGLTSAQEAMAGNMPILDESGDALLYRMRGQPSLDQMSQTARALDAEGVPIGMTPTAQGGQLFPFDALRPSDVPGASTALDELARIYPQAEVLPSRNVGFFDAAFGTWGDEGIVATQPFSGEATMQTLQSLADAPAETSMQLSSSPEVRDFFRSQIARDVGAPGVREDLQNTRRLFADEDWQAAIYLIRRGLSPAAALAAIGVSTSALARPAAE